MTRIILATALCAALAACASTAPNSPGSSPGQAVQAEMATATPAVSTLAGLAAANNATVADLVTKGQLFCETAGGPVAVADTIGGLTSYASVINASASTVQDVCAALDAVPVPPPSTIALASVPVVVSPAAAALAPTVTP